MVLKCPECGALHNVTLGNERITKNTWGEYYIVCGKKSNWVYPKRKYPDSNLCSGYMIVDMEKLETEEDTKKE